MPRALWFINFVLIALFRLQASRIERSHNLEYTRALVDHGVVARRLDGLNQVLSGSLLTHRWREADSNHRSREGAIAALAA